jgi:spermidine synthase
MAGLALGSFFFGRWIDRWNRPLLVYGCLELGLAIYVSLLVIGMPWIQEMTVLLLRGRNLEHTLTSLIKFIIAGIVLLPPTILMGGTLPVLAKFITRSSQTIGRWLGILYGLNTFGAVLGSLAAAYVLILRFGVNGTIIFAVSITAAIGIASCFLALRKTAEMQINDKIAHANLTETSVDLAGMAQPPISEVPGSRPAVLYTVAFTSGFITLAAEVLWTRLFINFLTSNVLIFATILGAFLTGIAFGSFIISRWVDRVRSLDVVVGISILVSAVLLGFSIPGQKVAGMIFEKIFSMETIALPTKVNLLFAFMFLVVAVPATVFGTVLPALFRWSNTSLATLGRNTGRLYAWNTIGSIAGSFASAFLMITFLGLNTSLLLLTFLYSLMAVLVVRQRSFRLVAGTISVAALVLIAMPSIRKPIYWYNGGFTEVESVPPKQTLFLDEGVEATIGVAKSGRNFMSLTSNGVVVAESSLHDRWDLLLKAHLPMLIHENPRRVALVGLGAGFSLGAVEAYEKPRRIDTIEIAPEVVPAHRLFGKLNGRPWEDPRVHIWINDGRHYLLTTEKRYDVISVDPTDPPVVYQYSQDFMQVCHDRLRDGGIMVQWVPLFHLSSKHIRVIMNAFLNVFPESYMWYDGTSILLMGRRGKPLEINISQIKKRLRLPEVKASMATIGSPDVWLLLSTYMAGPDELEQIVGRNVPENSDNRPYLEYAILRSPPVSEQTIARNLEMLKPHWESIVPLLKEKDRTPKIIDHLKEEKEIMKRLLRARINKHRGKIALWKKNLQRLIYDAGMNKREFKSLWPFYR